MTTDNRTNGPTDALALVEDVIAIHADRIGTHFEGCYKYHVACLAVAVKHRLGGDEAGADLLLAALDGAPGSESLPNHCQSCGAWGTTEVHLRGCSLDGAPEPEVAELPETGLEVRDGDGDLVVSGEHRRVLHQGGYVCDTCVNILGINVRWDRADRMEGHPLPVGGESK